MVSKSLVRSSVLGWPPADFAGNVYYMLGNTNTLSVLFRLTASA